MGTNAGTAYMAVEPDLKGFGRDLARGIDPHVDKSAKHVESRFGGAFKAVAGLAGGLFAGGAIVGAASDLNALGLQVDTFGRKAKTVFEGSNADVTSWAKSNASAFGVTDDTLTGLAASFGDLLKPMGFTAKQAADMSTDVVGLSGALSAWSGGQRTASEVSDILAKAMLGERDSLKELGISISEADVQGRLATKGQKDLTGAALEQAKAVATQELIFEKSADAQKAWADGSFDAVKKQNALKEKIGELKEDLAAKLRPAFAAVVGYLVDKAIPGLERFGGSLGPVKAQIGDFFSTLKTGFTEDEGTPVERFALKLRDMFTDVKAAITGVDWQQVKSSVAGVDWDKLGAGATIFGAGLGFVAEHAGALVRFMPLLVAGFVAVQLAQAANNTVGKNSIIGFGLQIGSTLALAASNRTLATSIAGSTLATEVATGSKIKAIAAATAATVAGIGTQIVAWVAMGVQSLLAAAKVAAAWLIAMGPIALVAAAVIGLGVLVVKNWDTIEDATGRVWDGIRNIVSGAWQAIKNVVMGGVRYIVDLFLGAVETVLEGGARMFGWVPGVGDKLRDARDKFAEFRDGVNEALGGIKDKTVDLTLAISKENNTNKGTAGDPRYAVGGLVPGQGNKDSVRAWLMPEEYVTRKAVVREQGVDRFDALNAGKADIVPRYAKGGLVGFRAFIPGVDGVRGSAQAMFDGMAHIATVEAKKSYDAEQAAAAKAGTGPAVAGLTAAASAMVNAVLSRFPDQTMTSGRRSAAENARVGGAANSDHLYGRAADFAPGSNAVADFLRNYTGIKQVLWQVPGHYDHVHGATTADNGGILPPGTTIVRNNTGANEVILPVRSLRELVDRLVQTIQKLITPLETFGKVMRETARQAVAPATTTTSAPAAARGGGTASGSGGIALGRGLPNWKEEPSTGPDGRKIIGRIVAAEDDQRWVPFYAYGRTSDPGTYWVDSVEGRRLYSEHWVRSDNFAEYLKGGMLPGLPSQAQPIVAHGGEGILTAEQMDLLRSGKGSSLDDATINRLAKALAAAIAANPIQASVSEREMTRAQYRARQALR